MISKMKKIVSFDKLESALRRQLLSDYPDGFGDAVMRIEAPKPFYAVLLESDQATYLVKLNNYLIRSSVAEDDEDDDADVSMDLDVEEEEE